MGDTEITDGTDSVSILTFIDPLDVSISFVEVLASLFIIAAGYKLYKSYTAPGVKLMFFSIVATISLTIIYLAPKLRGEDIESLVLNNVFSVAYSLFSLTGSYGFYCLSKHLSKEAQC